MSENSKVRTIIPRRTRTEWHSKTGDFDSSSGHVYNNDNVGRANSTNNESQMPLLKKVGHVTGKVAIWSLKPTWGVLTPNANPMGVAPGSITRRFTTSRSRSIDDALLANEEYRSWPADIRYRAWVDSLENFNRDKALSNLKRLFYIRTAFSAIWLFIWLIFLVSMLESDLAIIFTIGYVFSVASLATYCFSTYLQYQVVQHERLLTIREGLKIALERQL